MARDTENEEFFGETDDLEGDTSAEFERVLSGFDMTDSNVTYEIRVYRIASTENVKGQREKYLFSVSPTELPIFDRIRNEYGTGIYRIRIYEYQGKKPILKRAFDIEIEAPTVRQTTTERPSEIGVVLSAIEKSNANVMALMERLLERPQQNQIQTYDPMAMMEKNLSMLSSLAGLRQEPRDNGLGVEAMLGLITKGMELGQQAQGSSEPKGVMDLIAAALPTLLEKFQMPAMTPTQPQTQPIQHQPNQPPPQQMPNPAQAYLVQIIHQLGQQAKQKVDVAQVAPWLDENVPPAMLGELLHDPLALDKLSEAFPVIREERGWFAALFNELRKGPEGQDDLGPRNEPAGTGTH
jgi:hypothetical protein